LQWVIVKQEEKWNKIKKSQHKYKKKKNSPKKLPSNLDF